MLDKPQGPFVLAPLPFADPDSQAIFNNAGQVWNPTFYWNSLAPPSSSTSSQPSKALLDRINQDFGSLAALKKELLTAAEEHFGSGWAWLTVRKGSLKVETTPNAETPMAQSVPCLLTLDGWEHAYYLDYENERPAHLEAVVDGHLNWSLASSQFEASR